MDLILSIIRKQKQSVFRQEYYNALRSGLYTQQTNTCQFENENGEFCVLGVAGKILGLDTRNNSDDLWNGIKDALGSKSLPYIYRLNDVDKLPFLEIAEILESNEEHYFVV